MLKLYSSVIHCETCEPSFCAGVNLIRCAASMARSVRPSGRPLTTVMFDTCRSAERRARSLTDARDVVLARLLGEARLGLESDDGAARDIVRS